MESALYLSSLPFLHEIAVIVNNVINTKKGKRVLQAVNRLLTSRLKVITPRNRVFYWFFAHTTRYILSYGTK